MPLEIEVLENGEGVLVRGSGVVTVAEIVAANEKVYSPEYLAKQRYQLWDLTGAEVGAVNPADLRTVAQQDSAGSRQKPGLVLAVVGEKDLTFGLARTWETFVDLAEAKLNTRVFRQVEEAKAWIRSMVRG